MAVTYVNKRMNTGTPGSGQLLPESRASPPDRGQPLPDRRASPPGSGQLLPDSRASPPGSVQRAELLPGGHGYPVDSGLSRPGNRGKKSPNISSNNSPANCVQLFPDEDQNSPEKISLIDGFLAEDIW